MAVSRPCKKGLYCLYIVCVSASVCEAYVYEGAHVCMHDCAMLVEVRGQAWMSFHKSHLSILSFETGIWSTHSRLG